MKEDKIEVGEYVRTKEGYIGKIEENFNGSGVSMLINYRASHNLNDIVKHSKNIINLIEERRCSNR